MCFIIVQDLVIKMYVDKDEVLRYLGVNWKKADANLVAFVDDCIREILDVAQPKYSYRIFDLKFENEDILIDETNTLLEGKSIKKHLCNSSKCAAMGATLGIFVDKKIQYYKSYDLTRSLVLDACGTALIESICDEIEEKIKDIAKKEYGLNITSRYSPGYGDFPLSIQPELLNILETNRFGLTVNEQLIMIPRKSVTAIIGLQEREELFERGCQNCLKNSSCIYRRSEKY